MKFIYLPLISFFLWLAAYGSCIEREGILKLNQQIVSNRVLDNFPEAVPMSSVLAHLRFYEPSFPKIEVIDLDGTYLYQKDFKYFADEIISKVPNLKVLVLKTLHLDEDIWNTVLFPLLKHESFEYLNVYGTTYDNKDIQPILEKGREKYETEWIDLSRKLIFTTKTYYPRLKKSGLWIQNCERNHLLDPTWDVNHQKYYETYARKVEHIKPLHILTGNEEDQDLEESEPSTTHDSWDEEAVISGEEIVDNFKKLTLAQHADTSGTSSQDEEDF